MNIIVRFIVKIAKTTKKVDVPKIKYNMKNFLYYWNFYLLEKILKICDIFQENPSP